jgi:hypothetical protein
MFTKAWRTAPASQPTKPTAAKLQRHETSKVCEKANVQSEQKSSVFSEDLPLVCPLGFLFSSLSSTYGKPCSFHSEAANR